MSIMIIEWRSLGAHMPLVADEWTRIMFGRIRSNDNKYQVDVNAQSHDKSEFVSFQPLTVIVLQMVLPQMI